MMLTILLLAASQLAGQNSIDKVCLGTERYYRVTGEPNATYSWQITDPAGLVRPQASDRDTIAIIWNTAPGLYRLSVIQHALNGCDAAMQLGTVEVFESPLAFAGNYAGICTGSSLLLSQATAQNYSAVVWTTSGDGIFNDSSLLNPIYTPGPNDSVNGQFTVTLTASGFGNPGTCTPAVASATVRISSLAGVVTLTDVSCYGQANGVIQLTAAGGIEPYTYMLEDSVNTSGLFSGLVAEIYNYTISDSVGCEVHGAVTITQPGELIVDISPLISSICTNSPIRFTSTYTGGGTNVTYEWSGNGAVYLDSISSSSPLFISPVAGSYSLLCTVSDENGCESVSQEAAVTVNPEITPVFGITSPLCLNSPAPALPDTSANGVSGTWVPASINTAIAGTTSYTFTPDSGQCAAAVSITIVISNQIIPAFESIGPLCRNSAAPALPDTSTNGISGSWVPATINTAFAGTFNYIFTPDTGQCAVADTMNIAVNNEITPLFTSIGPLCQNSTAPALPDTSTNGISGSWVPATINIAIAGTSTYIFTPDAGQCAVADTMSIVVNNQRTPLFAAIGPLCQNSIAPALPDTSSNGISGTWVPPAIITTIAGTSIYTFIPDSGQCAVSVPVSIVINSLSIPEFGAIGPLCQNSTAPALPDTSTNGISGSWLPTTISTSTAGTTAYTFTPDTGQCAAAATLNIVVTSQIPPTFPAIGPLCLNSTAPALPAVSTNIPPITGTWNPAPINTSVTGITNYTFTPDTGQCASTATIGITVTSLIVPDFEQIGPLCMNSIAPALPQSSTNTPAITGTWNPDTINTTVFGPSTYTFTPDSGQCAEATTMVISITNQVMPTFTQIGPFCLNSSAPALPGISTNIPAITGTWTPATINTSALGTTNYTFMPDSGLCATSMVMSITIIDEVLPTFVQIGPLCLNSAPPLLPFSSTNTPTIIGNWDPEVINTTVAGTTTYTFTPDAGQCATSTTMDITITDQILPVFMPIGPLCQGSSPPILPLNSTNIPAVSGTWTPAVINTAVAGTTTYTFTPGSGQCAAVVTMDITIINQVIPTFESIGPLCQYSTAPVLPLMSTNTPPVSGTWYPPAINTIVAGTTIYTFMPAAGQCAAAITLSVTVTNLVVPSFVPIGPLCLNSTPPQLPQNSTNTPAIAGIWNPAAINTSVAGTTTYTFTPAAGQCAAVATMAVTITNPVLPAFNPIGPLCINSLAPALPQSSANNPAITGIWNPATINTSVAGANTYTFTPAAGQCASTETMAVTIANQILPTFNPVGPLCLNSPAPLLPQQSTNTPAITGKWNPAIVSTAFRGTTTYTFTPDTGQCAKVTDMTISVSGPQINQIKTITSTNGLANGHAEILAVGVSPLTYSIDSILWQAGNIISDLVAGTYTAWVKDANGCITSQRFVILNTVTGNVEILANEVQNCISVPFVIPLMAYHFTNISSFTIQLAFDSTMLDFTGLSNVNTMLNGTLSSILISPGILEIRFTAADSITLLSEDLLLNLNFISSSPGRSVLEWNWLKCVIYSAYGYEIPAIYTNGAVEVRPSPPIYADGSGAYCEGTRLKLNSGSLSGQDLTYLWTSPKGGKHSGEEWDLGYLTPGSAGEYKVVATDSTACSGTETVDVKVNAKPYVSISDEDTLCSEQVYILKAGTEFAAYTWQDGSEGPQLATKGEGWYWVIVTDTIGCMGSDSVLLKPCDINRSSELHIWLPNAFSPNGDGINDTFGPKYGSEVKIGFNLRIFNKWGEQIFESSDLAKGWDGTFKGQLCLPGLYTWVMEFKAPEHYYFAMESPQTGNVMLLK